MSDFLTRLAERQLARIDTIEPRIKPLYAPEAPDSQAPSIVEEIASPPAPRRDEKIGPAQTSQLRAPTVEATRSVDGATMNLRVAQPPLVDAQTESHGRMNQPGAEPVTRDLELNQAAHGDAEAALSIPAKVSPVQWLANIEPFDAAQPKSGDSSSSARLLLVPSAKTEPLAPLSLINSTKDAPAQREVELAAPVSLSSRKEPIDELPKPVAEAAVQVTIGRIEVTVLTQATPPKRTAAERKPSLSLDDYLARRHGRER